MVPLAITVRVKAEAMPEDPYPDTRHDRAQIRTAVSDDLIHWNDEGLAEEKGPAGSWDMIILRRPFGSFTTTRLTFHGAGSSGMV
jgi:hypothetical protein